MKGRSIIIVPKDKTKISDIFMLWETKQARRGRPDSDLLCHGGTSKSSTFDTQNLQFAFKRDKNPSVTGQSMSVIGKFIYMV